MRPTVDLYVAVTPQPALNLLRRRPLYLDVTVDDLVLVQVAEPLQDLPGVEDYGGLLQWTPLRTQQRRQASCRKGRGSVRSL